VDPRNGQAEARVRELERQLAQLEKDHEARRAPRPIEQELIELLKASEDRIRNLEYQLSIKDEQRKKQSALVLTPSAQAKYGTNQGPAYHKRFEEGGLPKSSKENLEALFFQSKKGLFGVDLDRKSLTPTKKKYARKC
jgi:hypothetical protein